MRLKNPSRRELLTVSAVMSMGAIAGCGGDTDNGGNGDMTTEGEPLPEGVTRDEFINGPVPEEYRTATSQGGEQRNPDQLVSKSSANFQEASEAVAAGDATEGNNCGNCHEFIPDKNGDGYGACVAVQGYIGADDWCGLWEELEEEAS